VEGGDEALLVGFFEVGEDGLVCEFRVLGEFEVSEQVGFTGIDEGFDEFDLFERELEFLLLAHAVVSPWFWLLYLYSILILS